MITGSKDAEASEGAGKGGDKAKSTGAKDLRLKAQELSGLALDTLGDIMKGTGQDAVKLAAAREVLDRAHGRPRPAPTKKAAKAPAKGGGGMTVIVKRFTDVTPEDEAEHDATQALFK